MSKFEKWEENGMSESMSGAEKKLHQNLTDPVIPELIGAREKWNEKLKRNQEERIAKLAKAEQKGILIFPKNK